MIVTNAPNGAAPATRLSHRHIQLVFAGLISGTLLAALDQTIVATALPTIVGELGDVQNLSWVVTSYLLASTVSTLLYGKISDILGRKIVYQTAIGIFVVGSLLCGVAQDLPQLIAFRFLQGIGGGGLMSMGFAIVGDILSPRERGRYSGYLYGVYGFSSVAGPLAGGFFVDHLTWRWAFLINLPIGILAMAITAVVLRLPFARRPHRLDVAGSLLMAAAVTCVLLVTEWGGSAREWGSPVLVGMSAAAILLVGLFIAWEARAPEPLLPLHLFRDPIFRVSVTIAVVSGITLFGGIVFVPVFLQIVTGASATGSGLLLLPMMLAIMTSAMVSGRLITRTGRYRILPFVGLPMALVGALLFATMDVDTSRVASGAYMIVFGYGVGMVMQVLLVAVQNSVPYAHMGIATSAMNFARNMGASLGVAAFGAILTSRLDHELPRLLPPGAAADVAGDPASLVSTPAAIRALPTEVADAVAEAVHRGLQGVFLAMLPVIAFGAVLAWAVREKPLRETAYLGSTDDEDDPRHCGNPAPIQEVTAL